MSKAKRQQKQAERAIKQTNDIMTGRVKVDFYDRPKRRAQSNRIGGASGNEKAAALAERYMRLLRMLLPGILAMLGAVEEPRNPKKITHTLPVLMLYGIILFLSHTPSRRAANREIGGSEASALMKQLLDEYITTPHADTLARLLGKIDEGILEKRYEELLKEYIKSDKFKEINPGRILVAADGTQKFSRTYCWDERALSRNAGDPEKERYYAYMLESVIILENGMILPLLTEPLENGGRLDGNGKQDCETNAFKRLAQRIEKLLGKGCVTIVLDGLYATGPVMSMCKNYGWEFMIALKSESLKSVWEEFKGLRKVEPENTLEAQWGDRKQVYRWSNGIEYIYGSNHKKLSLNMVTCTESWYEPHPIKGKPCRNRTEYAWLSSSEVTGKNVFLLCTKIARYRWRIENHFLVLKHQGYSYAHCFSLNWNAVMGFHTLAKFAGFINAFIMHSELMADDVITEGIKGTIKKVWTFTRVSGILDCWDVNRPLCAIKKRCKIRFRDVKLKHTA